MKMPRYRCANQQNKMFIMQISSSWCRRTHLRLVLRSFLRVLVARKNSPPNYFQNGLRDHRCQTYIQTSVSVCAWLNLIYVYIWQMLLKLFNKNVYSVIDMPQIHNVYSFKSTNANWQLWLRLLKVARHFI